MKSNSLWSRRPLTFVMASLVGAGAVLLAPTSAQAHSELVGSTPAENATLQKAPTQVSLEFNEEVQQQGGAITVTGPDGARYDINNTFTASGTEATVDLRDISEAGRFSVTYRIVSADGHVVQGEYPFRLQGGTNESPSPSTSASENSSPPATVTPSASPAAQEGDTDGDEGGSVIWVLGLGAIGLALIAAMIAVFTRRGRG